MTFRVKLCSSTAKAPTRGSRFAAGHDLYASEPGVIPGRGQGIIKTGISVALPQGTYGRVAPRSGLAAKNGINTGAGVIDSDYRGEIGVVLFNHKDEDFNVSTGDRVAQLIIEQICMDDIEVVETLDDTDRAAGGFGSTGTN